MSIEKRKPSALSIELLGGIALTTGGIVNKEGKAEEWSQFIDNSICESISKGDFIDILTLTIFKLGTHNAKAVKKRLDTILVDE